MIWRFRTVMENGGMVHVFAWVMTADSARLGREHSASCYFLSFVTLFFLKRNRRITLTPWGIGNMGFLQDDS